MNKEKPLSEKMKKWVKPIHKEKKDVAHAVERLKKRGLKRTTYPKYLMITYEDLMEIFGDLQ